MEVLAVDKDSGAKDKEFYMEAVQKAQQERIRQSRKLSKEREGKGIELKQKIARNNQGKTEETITINDKDRNLLEGKVHDLRLDNNEVWQERAPQVKNLRSSPVNEHVKGTVVNLRPQVQMAANNNQPINIKLDPYFDHYSKVENKGLLEQSLQTALDGVKHQVNRQIQKHQIKGQEQTQQARSH